MKPTLLLAFFALAACNEYDIQNTKPEDLGTAVLKVVPPELDYGVVAAGEEATDTFTISNEGDLGLEVLTVAVQGSSVFTITTMADNTLLQPGDALDVVVSYLSEGNDESALAVVTADSQAEAAKVRLIAGRPADPDMPVAVCSADPNPATALSDEVTWIGSASYDPSGLRIADYDWTLLSQPGGSTLNMPAGQADRSGFAPYMAGSYEAQLIVTNEEGIVSAPCLATLEVIPAENMWIEMYWTHSGDDMDLHLLAPGGTRDSNTDCYFGNCVPPMRLDWGSAGDQDDDPNLDMDDIPGTGPENINILAPEDGTYEVYVHDYPGSSYTPTNTVTVNIYLAGALAWTDTRNISGENTFNGFARINWTTGQVTPM